MTTGNPVALVTGASTGIGKATALALVKAGFEVIGTSRNTIGVAPCDGVMFLDLQVASDESVTTAVRRVIQRFGRLDVLVNNAGVQDQDVFDINVFGLIRMTKAVLPQMRAQGSGRIINISSVVGFIPMPYMAIYAASKHAVEGYSESLDHEVREHGVRVLLIEPGWTKTGLDVNSVKPDSPLRIYAEQRHIAEKLIAQAVNDGDHPATIAKAIVAAATDKNPKLRYTAGSRAARVSTLRRLVPAKAFDKQIRKLNQLAG
jgi:NAD(P)-dependent dehydrogenase (short-subunit alcohol dehydrogenase family)